MSDPLSISTAPNEGPAPHAAREPVQSQLTANPRIRAIMAELELPPKPTLDEVFLRAFDRTTELLKDAEADGTLSILEEVGENGVPLEDQIRRLRAQMAVARMVAREMPAARPQTPEQNVTATTAPANDTRGAPSAARRDDILTVIRRAGTPLTRTEIVAALKMETEGKLGANLAWMVGAGLLINCPPHGYWPASDPSPV